jgi:hypothetical protein
MTGIIANTTGGVERMEQFLKDYIERVRPHFSGIPEKTAHDIASAFLAFKFGLYSNASNECSLALSLLPDGGSMNALKTALMIVRANAEDLDISQVQADLSVRFPPEDHMYLAINLPLDRIEDLGSLELDNALIMLYGVATLTSPEDEQALDEHRKYIIKLLSGYKKALGIA